MLHVLRSRPRVALVAFFWLIAAAMLSFGSVASAAPPSTKCPVTTGDGTHSDCILEISGPWSVADDQPFTVHVSVTTDGTVVAKGDSCAANAMVSLDLSQDYGEGLSYIRSYTAKASGGVANFSIPGLPADSYAWETHVVVPDSGACSNYRYHTDESNVPFWFRAIDVPPGQPIVPCPDNVSCAQAASGSGTAATLYADTGWFDAFFQPLPDGQGCGGTGPADHNGVLNFTYSTNSPADASVKTIVMALKQAKKGIGRYKVCWLSPDPFKTSRGTAAPRNFAGNYYGYLPICKEDKEDKDDDGKPGRGSPPCVLFKHAGRHDSAYFGILAPPGDPMAYEE
jgi:hypothetical protein